MREACSNCPFKEDHNPADITLADFWGIPEYLRKNFENSRNGISLVVARTEKGRHFWDKVKSASICYKAKEADALPGNPALRYPLDLPVGWDEFKADFPVMPFTDFLKKWSFPQTVSAFTPVSVREKCAAAVLRFLNAIRSSGLFRPQVLILTHPLRYNYGGILQAFALQKALRKCGFRAVTWDTPYPGINPNPRLPAAKKFRLMLGNAFLKYVLRRPDVWVRPWNGNRDSDYYYDNRADDADRERRSVLEMKSRYTLPFIWKHIRLTRSLNGASAYVAGSDQIWRRDFMGAEQPRFFFDFLPENAPVKRISYAASFGKDKPDFSPDELETYGALLRRFDAVSVREDSGVAVCRDFLKRPDAAVMPDPAFLLTADDYRGLIPRRHGNRPGTLFCYILDDNRDKRLCREAIAGKLGLTIDLFQLPEGEQRFSVRSVEEWLGGIARARFVLADSFHGIVFSMIFNRPFLAFGNVQRGLARFRSLLEKTGLENRLIFTPDRITDELLAEEIDFGRLNRQ